MVTHRRLFVLLRCFDGQSKVFQSPCASSFLDRRARAMIAWFLAVANLTALQKDHHSVNPVKQIANQRKAENASLQQQQ
jgi:hypothetical protein